MFEGLLLPWQKSTILLSYSIFGRTAEVSSKLYSAEICQVSEKLWLFNHKRADFWLPNFGFKRSLLSLLKLLFYGLVLSGCIDTPQTNYLKSFTILAPDGVKASSHERFVSSDFFVLYYYAESKDIIYESI